MKALYAIIVLFVLNIKNVIFSFNFGNQLEQYEKYKKDIDMNVRQLMFELADECFSKELGDFHKCSSYNIVKLRKHYHPLWNGIVDLNALNNALNQSIIDCNYNITDYNEYKIYHDRINILFEIQQSSCKSLYQHLGGSSFEVSVEIDRYLLVCGVFDLFNNKYIVNCSIPQYYIDNDLKRNLCMKTTVYLDYEHYDAISDIPFNLNIKLKHMLMNKGIICRNFTLSSSLSSNQYSATDNANSHWIWQRNIDNFRTDYDIKGRFAVFPKKSELEKCILNKKLAFIGPSHTRFNWDLLVSLYINPAFLISLERKHGDILMFPKFPFYAKRFSLEIPTLISELVKESCQNIIEEYNIIIQVGTWDLEFWPLSNFIDNPKNGLFMINSLRELNGNSCGNIKLIWITTVPEESTSPKSHEYFNNNNNYKKHAAMQWILKMMDEVGWKKYIIVDAFSLALPLVTDDRNHIVCLNHFLCHEFGLDDMSLTSPGKAIFSHIIHSVCEDFIDYSSQINNYEVVTSEDDKDVYIVHMGVKRKVIVENTNLGSYIDKREVFNLSSSDFKDIVTTKRYPLLADHQLMMYEWKKYYIMFNRSLYYVGLKNELNYNCIKNIARNIDFAEILDDLDFSLLPHNSKVSDLIRVLNASNIQVATEYDLKCSIQFEIHKNWTKSVTSIGQECIWILPTEEFDEIPYADEVQKSITLKAREQGGYFLEGTLIQNGFNPSIYIYQNNSVYLIPNLATFMALGRDFSEVKRISPICFSKIGVTKELPSVV